MPDKFGILQPVVQPYLDKFQSGVNTLENFFGGSHGEQQTAMPVAHPDPSWHANAVAEANKSFADHQVHELARPQGHGLVDQKYGKGNRSPIINSVPMVDRGGGE